MGEMVFISTNAATSDNWFDNSGWTRRASLAVFVKSGDDAVMLYHVGGDLEYEVSENPGGETLAELHEAAPGGINVWEGKVLYDGEDGYPEGEFRQPTSEEWEAIREGVLPWNEDEWRTEEYLIAARKERDRG